MPLRNHPHQFTYSGAFARMSSGVGTPSSAPLATAGQSLNTPDMRAAGRSTSGFRVNAQPASNPMQGTGEYREHGRISLSSPGSHTTAMVRQSPAVGTLREGSFPLAFFFYRRSSLRSEQ